MPTENERERQAAIAMVAAAQDRLDSGLDDAMSGPDGLASSTTTMLPDWTIGHVLTHIARNADSHVQMLDGEAQYGGSVADRNAAIEAGAVRPIEDIVADVATSSQRLLERWSEADEASEWDGTATIIDGSTVKRSTLPMLRLREVLIHHLDLDLGDVTYADLPSEYVRRELRQLLMVYNARHSMGMGGLPGPVLDLPPYERIAWLMGRRTVEGVPDANA